MAKKKNAPTQVQTNAGVNPMGSPAPNKSTTLSQGLKIAGTGGITKSELSTIADTTGKSTSDIIKRLDKINQNLKGKDQTGINLNAGAANMLIKEAQKSTPSIFGAQPSFGTGRIGQTLQGMLGTPGYTAPRNPQSGAPYGGSYAATPGTGLMMGGTAIRPGGRQTVRGFGKQYQGMSAATGDTTTTAGGTTAPAAGGTTMPSTTPSITELPPDMPGEATPMSMPGIGLDLANWATGFKAKRSSRKGAGARAQGYGSQRVNPAKVNLNVS